MKRIPDISDKKLEMLVKKIKPVVRCSRLLDTELVRLNHEGDLLCYIEYDNPRMDNFVQDPKPKSLAEGLKHFADVKTYHKFGVPVLFSPSIAEVLAQIPKKYLDEVVAFETIAHGLNEDNLVDDYHVTVTRLYKKE
jgi:hypothetical protein